MNLNDLPPSSPPIASDAEPGNSPVVTSPKAQSPLSVATSPSPASASTSPAPANASCQLTESAIAALQRAIAAARLYGADHALARSVAETAAAAFATAAPSGWRIAAIDGQLLLDGRYLKGPLCTELSASLRTLGIIGLQVDLAPTLADVRTLQRLLSHAAVGASGGASATLLCTQLVDAGVRSVKLLPLSAAGLAFIAGARGGPDHNNSALISGIIAATLDPALDSGLAMIAGADAAPPPGSDGDMPTAISSKGPSAAAARLDSALRDADPAIMPGLRSEFARAAQDQSNRARIADAILELRPELRSSLLFLGGDSQRPAATDRAGATDTPSPVQALESGDTVAWLMDLCEKMPTAQIVEALRAVENSGQTISPSAMLMLAKLSRQSGLTDSTRRELESIAEANSARAASAGGLSGSLAELLATSSLENYCPEDYARLLERAARQTGAVVCDSRYQKAFDADSVVIRSLEIAGALVDSRKTALASSLQPFRSLIAGVGSMLSANRLDLLWHLVQLAREPSDASTTPSWTNSCSAAKRALSSPAILPTLLADARRDLAQQTNRLSMLAECAPLPVIESCFDVICSSTDELLRSAWAPVLTSIDPRELRTAIATFSAANPTEAALRPVIEWVVSHVADAHAGTLLEPLVNHEDPAIRLFGVRYAARACPKWSSSLASVAINTEDRDVHRAVLERCLAGNAVLSVNTLGQFIEGTLTPITQGQLPDAELLQLAANCLSTAGLDGRRQLAGLLVRLNTGMSFQRIRACQSIAHQITTDRGDPIVREALHFWHTSPAYFLGLLMPRFDAKFLAADSTRSSPFETTHKKAA